MLPRHPLTLRVCSTSGHSSTAIFSNPFLCPRSLHRILELLRVTDRRCLGPNHPWALDYTLGVTPEIIFDNKP